jgi:hypothetical protein
MMIEASPAKREMKPPLFAEMAWITFDTYFLREISSLRRIRQPPVHYSA